MKKNHCCLGPYTINSSLERAGENTFIDNTKTRRVVTFTPIGEPVVQPTSESQVLKQQADCGDYVLTWFECPDQLGRTYTLLPTACEVAISSFEGGLNVKGGCDASKYGASVFCQGKTYIDGSIYPSDEGCFTKFTFDQQIFSVSAHESSDFGLYNCSSCAVEPLTVFQSIPDPPSPATQAEPETEQESLTGQPISAEDRTDWTSGPTVSAGDYVFCNETATVEKSECQSHSNPSTTSRISGPTIIAYENRDADGTSSISLKSVPSTVNRTIVYYRSGARARIPHQDTDLTTFTVEIYDDLELNDVSGLSIGFLSGPIAGQDVLSVIKLDREIVNNKVRNTLTVRRGSIRLEFADNNDLYVEFFLSGTSGTSTFAVGEPIFSGPSIPVTPILDNIPSEEPQYSAETPRMELMALEYMPLSTDDGTKSFFNGQWTWASNDTTMTAFSRPNSTTGAQNIRKALLRILLPQLSGPIASARLRLTCTSATTGPGTPSIKLIDPRMTMPFDNSAGWPSTVQSKSFTPSVGTIDIYLTDFVNEWRASNFSGGYIGFAIEVPQGTSSSYWSVNFGTADNNNGPKLILSTVPGEDIICTSTPSASVPVPVQFGVIENTYTTNNAVAIREIKCEAQASQDCDVWFIGVSLGTKFAKKVHISAAQGRHIITSGPINVPVNGSFKVGLGAQTPGVQVWRDNLSGSLNLGNGLTAIGSRTSVYPQVPPFPQIISQYFSPYWSAAQWHYALTLCLGEDIGDPTPQDYPTEPCPVIMPTGQTPVQFTWKTHGNKIELYNGFDKWLNEVKFEVQGQQGAYVYFQVYKQATGAAVCVESRRLSLTTSNRHFLSISTNHHLQYSDAPYWYFTIGTRQHPLTVYSVDWGRDSQTFVGGIKGLYSREFIVEPGRNFHVAPRDDTVYSMQLCLTDTSEGSTPPLEYHLYESTEVGDNTTGYTDHQSAFGNWYSNTTGSTQYIRSFEQEISAPVGSHIDLWIIRKNDQWTDHSSVVWFSKRIAVTSANRVWYSTGEINIPVANGLSFACMAGSTHNATFYGHDVGERLDYLSTGPWGRFDNGHLGVVHHVGPQVGTTPLTSPNPLENYRMAVFHQKIQFSNIDLGGLTESEVLNPAGFYLLGFPETEDDGFGWVPRIHLNSISFRNLTAATNSITKLTAYLEFSRTESTSIWWYILESKNVSPHQATVLWEQEQVITNPTLGLAKYEYTLDPPFEVEQNKQYGYFIGVGWKDEGVSIPMELVKSLNAYLFYCSFGNWISNATPGGLTKMYVLDRKFTPPGTSTPAHALSALGITLGSPSTETTGACCRTGLNCVNNTTAVECTDTLQGIWQGAGTLCANIVCEEPPPTGACCNTSDDSCEITYEDDCIGTNYNWLGAGTDCSMCSGGPVEIYGACCLSNGTCVYTTSANCSNIYDGTWQQSVSCSPNPCQAIPDLWACCVGGVCHEVETSQACQSLGGKTTDFHEGFTCSEINCPPLQVQEGCCCRSDGTFFVATAAECSADDPDNIFHGVGSICSPSLCDVIPETPEDAFDIPPHKYNGQQVPVANPDIAVAHNHLMIDRSEYTYVVYQAYEGSSWNVYLRQIRTIGRESEESDPQYLSPYIFDPPTFSLELLGSNSEIKYVVADTKYSGTAFCALFEVQMPWGAEVLNCAETTGDLVTTDGCEFVVDRSKAYVVASHNMSGSPPCDGNNLPSWTVGAEFNGTAPATASILGGEDSCVTITHYPSVSSWCYRKATCAQTSLYNDPYCPIPYLAVVYKPEDLWTLRDGSDIFTRVKYHAGALIEESTVTGGGPGQKVDIVFAIDFSGSMSSEIQKVRSSVPQFVQQITQSGVDLRMGLTIFGRGATASPVPTSAIQCSNALIFDGLQAYPSQSANGFTDDVSVLTEAMNYWGIAGGTAPGFIAVQFAAEGSRYNWREDASKYIFLLTDASSSELNTSCSPYTDSQAAAEASLDSAGIVAVVGIDPNLSDTTPYIEMSQNSGWNGASSYLDINSEDYSDFFSVFSGAVLQASSSATIVERDESGFDPTHIKPAEIMITYAGDLSDKWTYNKSDFEFNDISPSISGATKGLSAMPFELAAGSVYGIDPVHLKGDTSNWVFFQESGPIIYSHPYIGSLPTARSNPVIIGQGVNPKVAINSRNEIFVVYENQARGTSQIAIKGTGDFAQNSITGGKGTRITRFAKSTDFAFYHEVTLPGEGINQLCDMVIDKSDVIHLVWQSNRNGRWEIYYANGLDLFYPVRITDADSRSAFPSIDVDQNGNIYVVYHDNRFGPYQIMLSYKNENRVKPLLEQDGYHASLRSGYRHFVNTMPVWVEYPSNPTPMPGCLWAVKSEESENYIFRVDESSGVIGTGSGISSFTLAATAGSFDGYLYGITTEGDLLILASPSESGYCDIEISSVENLGTLSLELDSYNIEDATLDPISDADSSNKKIWVLLSSKSASGFMTLVQIDTSTRQTVLESTLFTTLGWRQGGITATSDGRFHLVHYDESFNDGRYAISDYPIMVENSAIFDFQTVASSVEYLGSPINILSLTSQIPSGSSVGEDVVYGLSEDNEIAIFATDGSISELYSITDPDGGPDEGPLPINQGDIVSIAFQFTGITHEVGDRAYFHVILKFYDNQKLYGSPSVVIDSRSNLESFVNVASIDSDAYFGTARGIEIEPGHGTYIYFDASHFRPGYGVPGYPYGFEPNQIYFVEAYTVDDQNNVRKVEALTEYSFSCSKCRHLGDNVFDRESCSYSFVVENTSESVQNYLFRVLFYADSEMKSIVRRYDIEPSEEDLVYVEIDNQKPVESSRWTSNGLSLSPNDKSLIQVYPALDSTGGFICGLNYYVRVLACRRTGGLPCLNAEYETSEEIESSSQYFCECSSHIFAGRSVAISEVGRWKSSAQGYSDTRVTDKSFDTTRPIIKTRPSGSAVIGFEESDADNRSVKFATFRLAETEENLSSGSMSWFDFDPQITGKKPKLAIDLYGRVSTTSEVPDNLSSAQLTPNRLPSSSISVKNCDITPVDVPSTEAVAVTTAQCNLATIQSNIISDDSFISGQIIKRVSINPGDVDYYTYNSRGDLVAVVHTCNIHLQVWGVPEVIAFRTRNENETSFGKWCPWMPEISQQYTEIDHKLSLGSGIKSVCIQAMTYNGVTVEYCTQIIGDYVRPVFEVRLYSDEQRENILPSHSGMFVASTPMQSDGSMTQDRTVYVEIIPSRTTSETLIYFDVLQQGLNDLLGIPAYRDTSENVFRGNFTIRREDNVSNVDGLARIRINFPGECESKSKYTDSTLNVQQGYSRDQFNPITNEVSSEASVDDPLTLYRQSISGRVGVEVVLRPTNDPYMIFGDPNYTLRQSEPTVEGLRPSFVVQNIDETTTDDSERTGGG